MAEIQVRKVNSRQTLKDFIHVVDGIYRGCRQYVPDFESDIKGLFNPKLNPGLAFSEIQPFVAYQDGKAVGRIVGRSTYSTRWNRLAPSIWAASCSSGGTEDRAAI